mmetsp:Transcript_35010/g.64342  ORF Transcript_35010/g.64342 Transcript_35010/m.64342 type:complete len:84 (-) Transcript_35010:338-589(-)
MEVLAYPLSTYNIFIFDRDACSPHKNVVLPSNIHQFSKHNLHEIVQTLQSILSNTNQTSLPPTSILLLPTASKTSSNGLPSTE